jgi:3-deoxy-D-manno-octulosonic-acid transferase
MVWVYTLAIRLYGGLIRFLSLFNPKAKNWVEGRKNWTQIKNELQKNKGAIWIHCSSLGEFEQGKPLVKRLRQKYPDDKLVLSFFSPSGYIPNKNNKDFDFVFYLPLDTQKKAKELIGSLNPKMALFVKYEFWPNLFSTLHSHKVPIYLVSAIFRKNQVFFKPYGGWYKNVLKKVSHFFIQNQESAQLLLSIGLNNYTIAGDTRLDQVLSVKSEDFKDKTLEEFTNNRTEILVAGSTWPQDEIQLKKLLDANTNLSLVIAPHEIHEAHCSKIKDIFKEIPIAFYTENPTKEELKKVRVLVVNTIGKLKYIYRFGKYSYIGGGFGAGIHNTLEAVVYNIPVFFGPKFQKFQEAKDLIQHQIGFSTNEDDFITTFNNLSKTETYQKACANIPKYLEQNKGAVEKVISKLVV